MLLKVKTFLNFVLQMPNLSYPSPAGVPIHCLALCRKVFPTPVKKQKAL